MHRPRIVITGAGLVSPLGLDLATSWKALRAGEVALRAGGAFLDEALAHLPVAPARFDDALFGSGLSSAELRKLDPFSKGALAAALEAAAQAGLEPIDANTRTAASAARSGVVFGVGYGASATHIESVKRIASGRVARLSPFTLTASMPNAPAAGIAMRFGLRGPALTVSTACASGLDAIGTALGLLRAGSVERVLCGGVDALCDDLGVGGMAAARALSPAASGPSALRPFDRARQGTAVGSGAAAFVLEHEEAALSRGAPVLGVLIGYGASSDAYHISAPLPGGEGAEAAMRGALSDAELTPGDIDAVFAHGTGTPRGDLQEGRALRRIFASQAPPITSTKGQTGHAMGGSGALNLAFALCAMREGFVPPTVGCEDPDPECEVVPVLEGGHGGKLTTCLVNAFGFGGHNASLALRAPR